MNVLFLTDGLFPFQLGGMQKHSLMLLKKFAQQEISVEVVHCGGIDYSPEAFELLFDANEIKFIKEVYLKFPKTDPFPGHYIRENKAYSKNAYYELENRMKSFDLVYAQGFTGWHFIKEKHRKQFDCPILVNFHGLEMFQSAPSLKVMAEYTLLKNSVKWNLRNADYVYSFGGQIDSILTSLGVKEDRILHQLNGIDESWLNIDIDTNPKHVRRFIFIGRAERRKGIEELNKVLNALLKGDKKFEFTFIGPIPDKLKINAPTITYLGEIRDVEVLKSHLVQHDCLVCPSHAEGMPTVILEAMASGLAIIATDVGAVARIVTENGILLKKPDVVMLQNAIETIIDLDENELRLLKQSSQATIRANFAWDKVIEQKIKDFKRATAENDLIQE